ncbi:hypothetical protein [Sulfobacillus sp. hq2]|uniref:hypothetical protein n=1 Tax=Sulfobacillus TaxID=28033 RepID=UPI0011AF83A3|nr:hypothetical protein [Sulfobacillus sp. hq2]
MNFSGFPLLPFAGFGSLGVFLVAVVVFGIPALLMWLWNLTLPDLFGWPRLRYWQAFRLELICGLLFGAFHIM